MGQLKCKHFLDFIFTSGILIDVAYGTTNIKYDSGETQALSHVVLTVMFKHAIGSIKITFSNGYSILFAMPNKTKQNKIV